MSPDAFDRAILSVEGEDREFFVPPASAYRDALLDELRYVRREAQFEADLAYADWGSGRSRDAYSVYRAAQDRADAAQDVLAGFAQRIAA
jgi:hypothetical protein